MRPWLGLWAAVAASALVAAAVVIALRVGESDPAATMPPPAPPAAAADGTTEPQGVVENCRSRSEGHFPKPFEDPANLVVGPLVVVGGAESTPARVVRSVGGQKYAILVRADHRARIIVPAEARSFAGLGYGPLPQGEITLEDAHQAVTFIACSADQPSFAKPPKTVGAWTFWSGFVVTHEPHCVALDVYADDDPVPRRVHLEVGKRCAPQEAAV
jgi:hypothetical protein